MEKLAVISGTGLIGSSMGIGLRAAGWYVAGWDPSPDRLDEAVARGAIDETVSEREVLAQSDAVVVLAGPAAQIARTLKEARTDALVTDVGSVKQSIVAAAAHLPHFVGGHPMSGGTSTGPRSATAGLFHGATWILTTDGTSEPDLERVENVVVALGANPVRMSAAEHDERVARVSHLPHVVAGALTSLVHDDAGSAALVGGGFRDMTRIASAESSWWAEVLTENSSEVSEAILQLIRRLEAWREPITQGDIARTSAFLAAARTQRSTVDDHLVNVRVMLKDEPGEIARVGRALERSGVDVRDFQLRHGEHGGGGVLTITVTRGGSPPLTEALNSQGFDLLPVDQR